MRRDTGHLSRIDVFQVGDVGSDHGNIGGLIGTTTVGHWCEVWAIGFNQDAIKRTQSRCFGNILSGLKSDNSGETQKGANV